MKKMIPINVEQGGAAKTILAGYYKFGCATLLGDTFGTSGTAILEAYEAEKNDNRESETSGEG